jgi:hypothetical protein
MHGQRSSTSNDEYFQRMLQAIGECDNGQEKLRLLSLMASFNPRSTKRALLRDVPGLAFFNGLFDPNGQPGEALGTVGKFRSYLKKKGIDGIQFRESIESIYGNLKLGLLSDKVYGGERKRLDFSQSNFAQCPERIGKLEAIAYHNSSAYWWENCKDNLKMMERGLFRDTLKRNPRYGRRIRRDEERCSYINPDRAMEAGLRIDRDENGNPRKMSVTDGVELGLVTPEVARVLEREGYGAFTPLYVSFRSTESAADVKADIINIMGWVPLSVRDADTLAQTIIDNVAPGVVPIFTGHSMGGMLAHTVGAKHNYASIGFNPLGLGEGIRLFIDKGDRERCKRANDVAHAECHPSFVMRGDWVSDERGSKVARLLVKKPYIGQRYIMSNRSHTMGMLGQHTAYWCNIHNYRNHEMIKRDLFRGIDWFKGEKHRNIYAILASYLLNPMVSARGQIAENLRRMEGDQLEYIAFQLRREAKRAFFNFLKEEGILFLRH